MKSWQRQREDLHEKSESLERDLLAPGMRHDIPEAPDFPPAPVSRTPIGQLKDRPLHTRPRPRFEQSVQSFLAGKRTRCSR